MFEGSAISRIYQIVSGVFIGLLGLPFLLFGGFAISKGIIDGFPNLTFMILFSFLLMLGVLAVLMSYRLITARGVNKGGGLLAPLTYRVLGASFIVISLLFIVFTIRSNDIGDLIAAGFSGFISYWCFIAARHRGAMRDLPKWQ